MLFRVSLASSLISIYANGDDCEPLARDRFDASWLGSAVVLALPLRCHCAAIALSPCCLCVVVALLLLVLLDKMEKHSVYLKHHVSCVWFPRGW